MRGNPSVRVPILRLAAGAALLAGLAGCGGGEKVEASPGPGGRGKAPAAKEAVPVAVQPVVTGVASSYYTATAVLEASSRAEIRARSTGVVEALRAEFKPDKSDRAG